jgi:RND family efflux transporter MFP subunit
MKKLAAWIAGGAVLTGLTLLAVASYNHMVRTDPTKARSVGAGIPVETQPAEVQKISEVIGAGGELIQENTVVITSHAAAHVLSVPVDLGDTVLKGQVLAEFDTRLFEAAIESAEKEEKQAEVQLLHDREQLKRLTSLNSDGIISKADMEQAQIDLATAELGVATAKKEWTEARISLDNAIVRSPVNGMVMDRVVNPGENVEAAARLFSLGTIDRVLIRVYVGEEKVSSVLIGQEAEVTMDAFPSETFKGTVVKIDPTIDSKTRTFSVFIRIENDDLKLRPGLTGFARIKREITTLTVPNTALINPVGEKPTLFTVDDKGIAHLRYVKAGFTGDGLTQILSGITEGERVVTVGQLYLKDKDPVLSGSAAE